MIKTVFVDQVYQMTEASKKVSKQRNRRQMLATGFASPADNFIENRLNIHDLVVRNDTSTYFFRVKTNFGESSVFQQNDILVVDRSLTTTPNCYGLFTHNNSFVLASVTKSDNEQRIKNLATARLIHSDAELWGIVIYCIHSFV